ncbi:DUF6879 family protein [Actinomadura atramentaria]|uniref:DUF6879 family protein n=1 Tax=Actinomadura atramentaria TaxID=1990 RepID=UPI00037B7E55|nr:DUF6879 family protein [Actinomadura atramentaria]
MRLDGSDWREFFDRYQRSAWRLELRSFYTMPQEQESFQRFASGERLPADYWSGWMARVSAFAESGRTIGRVHVLRRPLSEYLRFQFDYYSHHVRAGEDIRILDLTDRGAPELPEHDFWFFDDEHVVELRYREDGTQIGRFLLEEPDLDKFRKYRDNALEGAIPFMEYWQG